MHCFLGYPSRSAKEALNLKSAEDIPVLDNFENEAGDEVVTEAHPIEAVSSEVVFSPTRAPRPVEVTEAHPLEAESAELGRPTRAPRASVEVTEPHPLSEPEEVEDEAHVSPQDLLDDHDEVDDHHDDVPHPVDEEGGEWHDFTNPQSNEIVVNGK